MSDQPSDRRRRPRGLFLLVAVIVVVLLVEAAIVGAVFVSPTAERKLADVAASADRSWNGSGGEEGLRTRTARAATDVYREWIAPLWQGPEQPVASPEFTACVGCHMDYATQRRFTVYMNHPLHAEIGLACEACHPSSPHPNPPRPTEAVCADCHSEVEQRDSCGSCHPPGSLPHFYLLGAPRGAAVRCDVCHPKGAFQTTATEPQIPTSAFTGEDEQACLSCHEDSTCSRCHGEAHPADWLSTHGTGVGRDGATTCILCHTNNWCADRCHAVTQSFPFVPHPLPTPGVRP
ncbi:MAG: hypothetical protein ACXWWX_01335 [Actinomycetota bacterium]